MEVLRNVARGHMRKNANNETEMLTFVHSFESCTQDSSAVLAIIDDVFTQLKEIMPEMNSVYLRQDNVGVIIVRQPYYRSTEWQPNMKSI